MGGCCDVGLVVLIRFYAQKYAYEMDEKNTHTQRKRRKNLISKASILAFVRKV